MRIPQASAHRGWLAQHRRHPTPQEAGEAKPHAGAASPSFPLTVAAGRDVDERARAEAADALLDACRFAPRPVLHARLVLERRPDPAIARPAVVTASVDLGGRVVRARVDASTFPDAIDLLQARLRRNLDAVGERRTSRRRRAGRRDVGAETPPELPERPPGQPRIVRRKR